jgi:DNA polymerase-1
MDPRTLDIWGRENVKEKYGVYPDRLCDFFALTGDAVDNIPGARGIGPETAKLLIDHYETIDNLFDRLHLKDIPPPESSPLVEGLDEKKRRAGEKELLIKMMEISLGPEKLALACQSLKEMFQKYELSSKKNPKLILASLYSSGYEMITLYKKIIQLVDEIPIVSFQDQESSTSSPPTKERKLYLPPTEKIVLESTKELRYRGERKYSQRSIEDHLIHFLSRSLSLPLQYLRQSYHKLDRND